MALRTRRLLTVAVAVVFGFQGMRVLFASITWYLRDTRGVGTLELIPFAVAPFVAGFFLPVATRRIGLRRGLYVGGGLLAAAALAMQMSGDPGVLFWAAAIATAAFVGLLPLFLATGRGVLVEGMLVGIALDSLLKGLGGSLDLAYRSTWWAFVVVMALVVGLVLLLPGEGEPGELSGPPGSSGLVLLGIGPFLFVEFLLLQPQGWIAEVVRIPPGLVPVWVAAGNAAALWLVRRYGGLRWAAVTGAGIILVAVLAADGPAPLFAPLHLAAIAGSGLVLGALVPATEPGRWWRGSVTVTGGTLLFLAIGLAYYLPMDLRLPMTQPGVRIATGIVLLVVVVFAKLGPVEVSTVGPALAGALVVAAAFPLVGEAFDQPTEAEATGLPVRVATYNIHSAFDTSGRLDVEAIARVVEATGADVIGFQEVSRGRLINAGTDLYALLMDRLDMPYGAFFGTADPVWGNAIMSRYPLSEVTTTFLPQVDTPLRRGYLGAVVTPGGGETFLFISTHLQHVNDQDVHDVDPEGDLYPVHHEQLSVVLDEWGGYAPAVLVGDLNARPGWRQVTEVLDAGWVDAWEEAGSGPGYTANAADPQHRIDWIFHTPDLAATDAAVIESQASDHFAVAATLRR